MNKIMVVVSVLVLATAGYAASIVSDFEDGTLQNWWVGGTTAVVNPGIGVGDSYAITYARSDSDTYMDNTYQNWGSYTNWVSLLGNQMEVSFDMKQAVGSTGGPNDVTVELFADWTGVGKWSYSWSTPVASDVFTHYSTGMFDSTWTDAEAIAAGWVQGAAPVEFVAVLNALCTTRIWSNGIGDNGYDGPIVDNITAETYAAPALLGDANLDEIVDLQDFTILKANYGLAGGWGEGDFNDDNLVDLQDFTILKAHFGETAGGMSPIPEPATLVLLTLGGLLAVRRKK